MGRVRGGGVWFITSLMLLSVLCVAGEADAAEVEKTQSDAAVEILGDAQLATLLGSGSNFDYYVFSQQWPGTYCEGKGSCCSKIAKPVKFTVHGLWPENNDNSYPSCCTGPGFDDSKIGELYDYLLEYWPTLSCSSPKQCKGKHSGKFGFWQHEWEKHGTCSYPYIPDEATYFTVGLNLRLRYDISKILSDAGYVPSYKKYKTSGLVAAVTDAVGAKPAFSCKGQLINEVWVCLTKDLKIRDCSMPANTCKTYIQIPPFTTRSELVDTS